MNLELEAYEGELAMLRRCFQLVKHTGLAEKMGNIYFICGAVIFAAGCLPLLLVMTFWSAVFYVAIHFISKFW